MKHETEQPCSCTFEKVEARDILDAVGSMSKGSYMSFGVLTRHPGTHSPHELMAWAVADVETAMRTEDIGEKSRHLSNAVINARRSLNSVVDWYLQTNGFACCRNAPKKSTDAAELLLRRRVMDELTSQVVERAVRTRRNLSTSMEPRLRSGHRTRSNCCVGR
jgi:hypothetical protein